MEDPTRILNKKQTSIVRNPNPKLYGWAVGSASFHHAEAVRQPRAVSRMVLERHRITLYGSGRAEQASVKKASFDSLTIYA